MLRVVTTCHREGYELYGLRFVEGWQNWPEDAELWWYTEGFDPPPMPRTTFVPDTKVQHLQILKEKYQHYEPVSWQWDVVRYSNKVYAAYDALFDYTGIGVWLDNDCVTFEKLPEGFIESLLPEDCYMAMFKRKGMHTETGFWIMNCAHEHHQDFLSTWVEWYDSGAFKTLPSWHDCATLDATVRKFEKLGLIKTHSLSGDFEKDMHPMAKVELAHYMCHRKGRRKFLDYSPENEYAKEFFEKKHAEEQGIKDRENS